MVTTNWINRANLVPFLSLLGRVLPCRYRVDDSDAAALELGLRDTDDDEDRWFTYQLGDGPGRVGFRMAQCVGGDELMVEVEHAGSEDVVQALFLAAQSYTLLPSGLL